MPQEYVLLTTNKQKTLFIVESKFSFAVGSEEITRYLSGLRSLPKRKVIEERDNVTKCFIFQSHPRRSIVISRRRHSTTILAHIENMSRSQTFIISVFVMRICPGDGEVSVDGMMNGFHP